MLIAALHPRTAVSVVLQVRACVKHCMAAYYVLMGLSCSTCCRIIAISPCKQAQGGTQMPARLHCSHLQCLRVLARSALRIMSRRLLLHRQTHVMKEAYT